MRMDGAPAEPFGADVVVSLLEREVLRRTRIEIREVEEETHVKRLPYRAELLHQHVIEADEVFVLQRLHDRPSERDGTRFNRIARELASLNPKLREDVE